MRFLACLLCISLSCSAAIARQKAQGSAPDRTVEDLFKYAKKGQLVRLDYYLSGEALREFGNPDGLETLKMVQQKFGKIHSYSTFNYQTERNAMSSVQHYEAQLFAKGPHGATTIFGSAIVDCVYFYNYSKNTQCHVQKLSL